MSQSIFEKANSRLAGLTPSSNRRKFLESIPIGRGHSPANFDSIDEKLKITP